MHMAAVVRTNHSDVMYMAAVDVRITAMGCTWQRWTYESQRCDAHGSGGRTNHSDVMHMAAVDVRITAM